MYDLHYDGLKHMSAIYTIRRKHVNLYLYDDFNYRYYNPRNYDGHGSFTSIPSEYHSKEDAEAEFNRGYLNPNRWCVISLDEALILDMIDS